MNLINDRTVKRLNNVARLAIMLSAAVSFTAHADSVNAHINSPWPLGDVFQVQPNRATARPESSCKVAETYVALVDAGRMSEIGALFAEDAVFLPPNFPTSKTLVGRKEIGDWFSQVKDVKHATPISFIDAGSECFMEIAGMLQNTPDGKYHLTAIDHFTINSEGKIVRAVYYFRPDTIRLTDAARKSTEKK